MFDTLLWVLPYFVTHYAGQTTQGSKDDGDGVDQASGSKNAPKQDTSLPQRVYPLRLKRPLQESSTHDQSDALAPADLQPEKECGGGHRIRKISKPCSQQQSQSELQPSISHDLPQSDEMPLPVRVGESEVESYSLSWETDQYHKFTEQEAEYFESEYSFEKELVGSDEQSVEQCMSPRPPNLLVPHEFIIQIYFKEKGRLDIDDAREIVREIVNGMAYLKRHGVVHGDFHAGNMMYNTETGEVKLIDFGQFSILPGWEEGRSALSKSSDPSSTISGYRAGADELDNMKRLGQLLHRLLTGQREYSADFKYGEMLRKTILPDPDPYKSELKENAIHLVDILVSRDPEQMPSIEDVSNDPFFSIKQ
ncbi:hypothetical protein BASA83_012571 [Batrachochytrium salamandrivorans]|nr:hypothetical protein BASA83_012571 [Batrachochytrium salamandrivorans]